MMHVIYKIWNSKMNSYCLKIFQNVSLEVFDFDIFYQSLTFSVTLFERKN